MEYRTYEERETRQIRSAKRGCVLLGIAAVVLTGGLALQNMHHNSQEGIGVYREMHIATGQDEEKLLVLVNKENELSREYKVDLHWLQNGSCAVAEEMYDALREMLTDGSQQGREFVVASGYRSREFQQQLLEEDIQASMENDGLSWEEAYEKETRETMPPGYSEHETGLAADIVALDYQILDAGQEMTEENCWLQENCSDYGFILRYPKGAEEITGIDYEPWHFRYVGKKAALEITRKGITLEEYVKLRNS